MRTLSQRNYTPVATGYHAEETFRDPRRLEKYPKDLLYFVVPKTYDPKRPTGLIVFMHGGGKNTSRDAPMYTNLEYDELVEKGEAFDEWRLEHRRVTRSGSMIDAINRGNNRIDVSTENITHFTVWLYPRMIDVARPVTIVVDGRVRFQGQLKPSLVAALESYERRLDWGMIYPMKATIELK